MACYDCVFRRWVLRFEFQHVRSWPTRLSDKHLSASKRTSLLVFLGENRSSSPKLPVNIQIRIIPRQGAFRRRVVVVSRLVEDLRIIRNHQKTMCETRWDPEHALVFTRERLP